MLVSTGGLGAYSRIHYRGGDILIYPG